MEFLKTRFQKPNSWRLKAIHGKLITQPTAECCCLATGTNHWKINSHLQELCLLRAALPALYCRVYSCTTFTNLVQYLSLKLSTFIVLVLPTTTALSTVRYTVVLVHLHLSYIYSHTLILVHLWYTNLKLSSFHGSAHESLYSALKTHQQHKTLLN